MQENNILCIHAYNLNISIICGLPVWLQLVKTSFIFVLVANFTVFAIFVNILSFLHKICFFLLANTCTLFKYQSSTFFLRHHGGINRLFLFRFLGMPEFEIETTKLAAKAVSHGSLWNLFALSFLDYFWHHPRYNQWAPKHRYYGGWERQFTTPGLHATSQWPVHNGRFSGRFYVYLVCCGICDHGSDSWSADAQIKSPYSYRGWLPFNCDWLLLQPFIPQNETADIFAVDTVNY